MTVFLKGLAIQYFRGIGPEVQKMAPFTGFNFFVGANNSGKSTVLDFVYRYLPSAMERKKHSMSRLDEYIGKTTGSAAFSIAISKTNFVNSCLNVIDKKLQERMKGHFEKIFGALSDEENPDLVWIAINPANQQKKYVKSYDRQAIARIMHRVEWQNLWSAMINMTGGELISHWIPETLGKCLDAQVVTYPLVRLIPTNRQIGKKEEEFADFSGRGLIDRLVELQSPDHDKREDLELFGKINRFLQAVTGRETARIEIPHNREHILVHMDGKVLPLSNLGTGIHEVIMIAAFCTISEREIVCIEEPESHLHPLLQRKLIEYLQKNTSNQYFIATHSAAFIDTPGAAIFHVANDGAQTAISETILRRQKVALCADLGVRASDIVQSNFVIWVEGPSDRIYLQHWLKTLAPELKEALHFSIMFYGGRLLSHLTANDEDVTEFILLRSLNQNLCVLMDSDKSAARKTINGTKQRIQKEFLEGGGMAWVTKGREIENYLPFDRLQAAVATLYRDKYHSAPEHDNYGHALHFWPRSKSGRRSQQLETNIDKVRVAKLVSQEPATLEVLDLKQRLSELVERIQKANT